MITITQLARAAGVPLDFIYDNYRAMNEGRHYKCRLDGTDRFTAHAVDLMRGLYATNDKAAHLTDMRNRGLMR